MLRGSYETHTHTPHESTPVWYFTTNIKSKVTTAWMHAALYQVKVRNASSGSCRRSTASRSHQTILQHGADIKPYAYIRSFTSLGRWKHSLILKGGAPQGGTVGRSQNIVPLPKSWRYQLCGSMESCKMSHPSSVHLYSSTAATLFTTEIPRTGYLYYRQERW